ncbi:hypothetical protein D3C75_1135640 [compost metagenome]
MIKAAIYAEGAPRPACWVLNAIVVSTPTAGAIWAMLCISTVTRPTELLCKPVAGAEWG